MASALFAFERLPFNLNRIVIQRLTHLAFQISRNGSFSYAVSFCCRSEEIKVDIILLILLAFVFSLKSAILDAEADYVKAYVLWRLFIFIFSYDELLYASSFIYKSGQSSGF